MCTPENNWNAYTCKNAYKMHITHICIRRLQWDCGVCIQEGNTWMSVSCSVSLWRDKGTKNNTCIQISVSGKLCNILNYFKLWLDKEVLGLRFDKECSILLLWLEMLWHGRFDVPSWLYFLQIPTNMIHYGHDFDPNPSITSHILK